jgi:LSD1 subclass zinc finger protein
MSSVRLRRLQADYEKLRAFLAQQPRIRLIQAQGTPPERYQLEFQIKGLREVDQQLLTVANHMVEISLPLSYPRLPPQCRMLTPVFHPNIAPHAICIGDHWSAGEPLWSMVARIGEMIAYQSYNTKSPLNGEAARWVEANQHQLPLDRTNFIMDEPPPQSAGTEEPIIPFAADPAATPTAAAGCISPPTAIHARRADFGPPLEGAAAPTAAPMAILLTSPPSTGSQAGPPAQPGPPAAAISTFPPSLQGNPALPFQTQQPSAAPNIVIECGQCRSRYSLPSTAGGKRVRCKKCQAILVIPLRRPLP